MSHARRIVRAQESTGGNPPRDRGEGTGGMAFRGTRRMSMAADPRAAYGVKLPVRLTPEYAE